MSMSQGLFSSRESYMNYKHTFFLKLAFFRGLPLPEIRCLATDLETDLATEIRVATDLATDFGPLLFLRLLNVATDLATEF